MSYCPGKPYSLLDIIQKADAGDMEAMSDFVKIAYMEDLTDNDDSQDIQERLLRYLRQLAETEEYAEMLIVLARIYEKGEGAAQDPAEAIRLYEQAVRQGIGFGNECIGLMYFEGRGVPIDYEKAFRCFTEGDHEKSFCTLYSLGEMYRCGLYVEKSPKKALEYYEAIACSESSNAALDAYYGPACYRAAVAYHYGQGTEVDLEAAMENMEDARHCYSADFYKGLHISKRQLEQEWIRLNHDAGRLQEPEADDSDR